MANMIVSGAGTGQVMTSWLTLGSQDTLSPSQSQRLSEKFTHFGKHTQNYIER